MNLPILQDNNVKTMSSREMAALCKKRHDNTLLVIRDLEKRGLLENSRPQNYVHAQNGQQYVEYLSDKRDSLVIVARLSPEFMAAVIDRWQELEQQAAATLPNFFDPVAAARAFADEFEAKRIAQEQLAIAKPKIDHYDKIVNRGTLLTATQVGQKIGLSAVKLNRVLGELDVYNKAHKRGKAFKQWFIDKGLGEMKQTDMGHSQALFSLKGEAWVIEALESEGVA